MKHCTHHPVRARDTFRHHSEAYAMVERRRRREAVVGPLFVGILAVAWVLLLGAILAPVSIFSGG